VDQTIDAAGKLVIPGGIDPHTHMELPFGGTESSDDFRTGTIAAAYGGTTSIIDFAVQYKGQSLIEGIDNWHKKAEGKTAIDYGFHLITTELEDKQIEELYTAMDEGLPRRVSRRRRHDLSRHVSSRSARWSHLHAR
jgi:dihydropyrimidinase